MLLAQPGFTREAINFRAVRAPEGPSSASAATKVRLA
jgi:hypothetical protein